METRRRLSDAKLEEKEETRRSSLTSGGGESEEAADAADPDAARSSRAGSELERSRAESGQERKLKVRRQAGRGS